MFCYIKIREKGTLNWRALREDGKILVFNKCKTAKKYAGNLSDFVYEIISFPYHPMHKKSPIYGKKYTKVEW